MSLYIYVGIAIQAVAGDGICVGYKLAPWQQSLKMATLLHLLVDQLLLSACMGSEIDRLAGYLGFLAQMVYFVFANARQHQNVKVNGKRWTYFVGFFDNRFKQR